MKIRGSVIAILIGLLSSSISHALVGDLNLKVTKLRSLKGNVLISVFDQADGFPGGVEKAVKRIRVSAQEAASSVKIRDLEYGVYGISLVHDENSNNKIDTGLFGIPKEGIGFSRNPKVTFGPPKYSEAAFSFAAPEVSTFIEVKYF